MLRARCRGCSHFLKNVVASDIFISGLICRGGRGGGVERRNVCDLVVAWSGQQNVYVFRFCGLCVCVCVSCACGGGAEGAIFKRWMCE
jgi:hypothetical protein